MVGEVKFEFDERSEMEQLFSQDGQFVGYGAAELTERKVFLGFRLCSDEVRHGFRLGKVHLPVEERTARELTRFGSSAAGIDEPSEQLLLNIQTAVAGYLDRVFARERVRRTEYRTEHLVKHLFRPFYPSEMNGSGLGVPQGCTSAEQAVRNGHSLLSGYTDDGNSARPVRGRYGTNR